MGMFDLFSFYLGVFAGILMLGFNYKILGLGWNVSWLVPVGIVVVFMILSMYNGVT